MNEMLGTAVSVIITLGAFLGVVFKFVQPINELRLMIQKLNDAIDGFMEDGKRRDARIDKHGEQIDELNNKVGQLDSKYETLKTKVELYHNKE